MFIYIDAQRKPSGIKFWMKLCRVYVTTNPQHLHTSA